MSRPETNIHFKIKTRARHEGQYPQRFQDRQGHEFSPTNMRSRHEEGQYPRQLQDHQGHDLQPVSTRELHYPQHFLYEGDNDAQQLPRRQGLHSQQYPHQDNQEMHQVPSRQGKLSDLHSQQGPHFQIASPEHVPHNQSEKYPKYYQPDHLRQGHHPHHHKSQGPRVPPHRKTKPLAWFLAFCCTIFWVIIILGGLIVLIIFLMYHPESPHFQISTFTLNTLYLDNGNLLNADIRILADFNNSNRKVSVDFTYLTIDLYYGETRIGTQYIEPFYESNSVSTFVDIHIVTSQLRLPFRDAERLVGQVQNNRVQFDVKGAFRTRSNLGSLLHFSYWLNAHCTALVTSPPSGTLAGRISATLHFGSIRTLMEEAKFVSDLLPVRLPLAQSQNQFHDRDPKSLVRDGIDELVVVASNSSDPRSATRLHLHSLMSPRGSIIQNLVT